MLQQLAISTLVISMMFAIGLRTAPSEFAVLKRRLVPLGVAGVINIVVVPLVAFAALRLTGIPEGVVVGFMICAASPGGATGPLFAAQAGGDLAAAVVTMVGLALVSVVTTPLTLSLAFDVDTSSAGALKMSAIVGPMMMTLGLYQLLPLVAGMVVRRLRPGFAARVSKPMNQVANILLLVIIIGLIATRGGALVNVGWSGALLAVLLVVTNLALGATPSRVQALRRSLSMVTAVRNLSLALLISALYFTEPLVDAAILTFSLFTMVLPLVMARLWARTPRAEAKPEV